MYKTYEHNPFREMLHLFMMFIMSSILSYVWDANCYFVNYKKRPGSLFNLCAFLSETKFTLLTAFFLLREVFIWCALLFVGKNVCFGSHPESVNKRDTEDGLFALCLDSRAYLYARTTDTRHKSKTTSSAMDRLRNFGKIPSKEHCYKI